MAFTLAARRYSHLHIKVAKLEVDAIPLKLVIGLSIAFLAIGRAELYPVNSRWGHFSCLFDSGLFAERLRRFPDD